MFDTSESLNLDLPSVVNFVIKLKHPSDPEKDLIIQKTRDFPSVKQGFKIDNFVKVEDVKRLGFVHSDNTIKIDFLIEKNSYRAKLVKQEAKVASLNAVVREVAKARYASERKASRLTELLKALAIP